MVECDIMLPERINTSINIADHMTKILDRALFYRRVDYIMGHISPMYSPCYKTYSKQTVPNLVHNQTIDKMAMDEFAAAVAKCYTTIYP